MSIFSDNIRCLRAKKGVSQQKIADALIMTRARYVSYEDGRSEPPIEILIRLSSYFKISIDLLVAVDIRKYSIDNITNLPDNRIVLPIKVGENNENKIEIVPHKGKMGYLVGYNDPEYIENLQHMSLPFLRNGKYRAFPVEDDSMPPYNNGSYIIGKYVEKKEDLKSGKTYIFITGDGIVYKRYLKEGGLNDVLKSDNTFYKPYEINWKDVLEVWEFGGSINTKEFETQTSEHFEIKNMFEILRNEIQLIRNK